jgi:hypothetical protein
MVSPVRPVQRYDEQPEAHRTSACDFFWRSWRALLVWLRAKGVVSKTPLHTLRKEFGSQINARYGLLAASEQLRHGGIAVTARHHVENRSRPVLGFAHLLTKDERTIIPMDEARAP